MVVGPLFGALLGVFLGLLIVAGLQFAQEQANQAVQTTAPASDTSTNWTTVPSYLTGAIIGGIIGLLVVLRLEG